MALLRDQNAARATAVYRSSGPSHTATYGRYNPALIAADVKRRMSGVKVVIIFRHDDIQASALEYLPVYDNYGLKASWYMTHGNRQGGRDVP